MRISLFSYYKFFIISLTYTLFPAFLVAQGTSLSENGNDFQDHCFQAATINLTNGTNTVIGRVGGQELPNNTDPADYINFHLPSGGVIQWIAIETTNGTPTQRSFLALWDGPDCTAPVSYGNIENNNTVLFSDISTNGTLTLRGVDAAFDYTVTISVGGITPNMCDCQLAIQPEWISNLTPSTSLFPNQLIDEQGTLPICSEGGIPTTTWGNDYSPNGIPPAIIEINFPQWYMLHDFYLFDEAGIGDFRIEYLDGTNNWQVISNYSTDKYQEWVTFSNLDIATNRLRLTQLDNNANIAEIGVCGQPITADCMATLTIDSVLTTSAIYQATTIISSSIIYSDNDIQYKAATSIMLKSGFHARTGTQFSATLEPCVVTLQTPNDAIITRANSLNNSKQLFADKPTTTLTAFPNPFESILQINYFLPTKGKVNLVLIDKLGRVVQTIASGEFREGGNYEQQLDDTGLEGGTYFLVLKNEKQVLTEKIILLR